MNKNKILALIVGTTMLTGVISTTGLSTSAIHHKTNTNNKILLSSHQSKNNLLKKSTTILETETPTIVYNSQQFYTAIQNGGLIELGQNITLPYNNYNQLSINLNKNITINGNGNSIILNCNSVGNFVSSININGLTVTLENVNLTAINTTSTWTSTLFSGSGNFIIKGNVTNAPLIPTRWNYINNINITLSQNSSLNGVSNSNATLNTLYSAFGFNKNSLGYILDLSNEVTSAYNLDLSSYTQNSVNTFQSALNNAINILNTYNNDTTVETFANAFNHLQNAIKNLVKNTVSLQNEINIAKAINTHGYTPDSIKVLQNAIIAGESVVNNKDTTAQDVTTAMTNLQNAIKTLVVNTEALQNEINTAKAINTDAYTPDSVIALQNAITAGEAVVSNKNATAQDVAISITNLQNAIKDLILNKKPLQNAISNANKVLSLPQKLNAPNFSTASVTTLQNLIDQGQNALKENNTQQILNLTNKIINATNNLVINIPDSQFKTLLVSNIKNELVFPNNKDTLEKTPVTYGELIQLKSISRNNVNGIVSLQGIQYCENLTYFQTGYGQ
ncbi:MAG: hypothetical protein ACRC41_18185, partial [Sarcina sp.]